MYAITLKYKTLWLRKNIIVKFYSKAITPCLKSYLLALLYVLYFRNYVIFYRLICFKNFTSKLGNMTYAT